MNRNEGNKMKVIDDINVKYLTSLDQARLQNDVSEHGLVILPNQLLSRKELHELTGKLGETIVLPRETSFGDKDKEFPSIVKVSNLNHKGDIIPNYKGANQWHTDSDSFPSPYNYTWNFLYAKIIPNKGGETAFANCQKAFQTLSAEQIKFLQDKKIVVDPKKIPNFYAKPDFAIAEHDIICTHPETRKKTLYVSGHTNIITIKDHDDAKSYELMSQLHAHILQKENIYIHRWQRNDLLIWDNLIILHCALDNYGDQPRLLLRTQAFMKGKGWV